jgi:hypothetical protein
VVVFIATAFSSLGLINLDFRAGWWPGQRLRLAAGVPLVSGENLDAPAELRQRAPLPYIPSALLNENIERRVYMRYGTEAILETTPQLESAADPKAGNGSRLLVRARCSACSWSRLGPFGSSIMRRRAPPMTR